MRKHWQLVAWLGVLALSPLMTVACGGVECGPNTTEKNGQCVPTYQQVTCADGTSLNPDTGKCELDSPPVDCGAGTELQDGSCVVVAAACGDNAQLDANSSKCVPTDTVCGDGLAFTDGKCMPTDQVCDGGTVFSQSTGTCMPEATCQAGDVVLNGNCVRPAQKLAADADVTSSENDDPSMGGTANAMTLTDGQQTVFTGNVDAPTDLDGDGAVDQDVDVFSFEATAGQIFTVSVQPVDGTPMGFTVSDANGQWMRYSDAGFQVGSARKVLIPRDGTYYIAVAPAAYVASDASIGPLGEDGWSYVGTIEQADPLSATDVDTASADVTGQMLDITDNWFKLTNLTEGQPVIVTPTTLGAGAQGVLEIWSSATDMVQSVDLSAGTPVSAVLPVGDAYLFVDWRRVTGPNTDFDLQVATAPGENLGSIDAGGTASSTPANLAGDGDMTFGFQAQPGEVVEFGTQSDATGEEVELHVTNSAGDTVLDTYMGGTLDPSVQYALAADGGQFVATVTNLSSSEQANFSLTVNSITPTDEGSLGVDDNLDVDESASVGTDHAKFYVATFPDAAELSGALSAADGDVDLYVLDEATQQVAYSAATVGDETVDMLVPAGTYLFVVSAYSELSSGFSLTSKVVSSPAVTDAAGNDTAANAQTIASVPSAVVGQSDDTGADPDYYKVTLSSPTAVQFALDATSSCAQIDLRDAADNLIATDSDSTAIVGGALEPGDYYVVVTGSCSYSQGRFFYGVHVDEIANPADALDGGANDTDASATDASGASTIAGTLTSAADVDWYKIHSASAADGTVELGALAGLAAPNAGVSVDVYDDSQTLLGHAGDRLTLAASADYLIKVTGFDAGGRGNSYLLTVVRQTCGNGVVEGTEQCDDHNTVDGDGCSATCTAEGTAIAASGSSVTLSGEITSTDPTWDRPMFDCSNTNGTTPYDAYTIVNHTGADQTITVTANWTFDGFLHVFDYPFDPASPLTNCLKGNDDSNGSSQSQLVNVSIADGQALVIVASPYGSSGSGTYTIELATN